MSVARILERLNRLISAISLKLPEDPSLIDVIAPLSELIKVLRTSDEETIKQSLSDREKLRKVQQILNILERRQKIKAPTYIDDFLAVHPELSYPLKIPSSLFESERVRKVVVLVPATTRRGQRTDEISLDEAMTLLFPGLLTYRYGFLSKVPVGRWSSVRYRVSPADVSFIIDEKESFSLNKNQLPPEYSSASPFEKVYIPQEVRLRNVEQSAKREEDVEEDEFADAESTTYLPFCVRCGAVQDGDESCSCGPNFRTYASPPKAYPLVWNIVEMSDGQPVVKDPVFHQLFDSIVLSGEVDVKKVLYGFERQKRGQTWRVHYDKLFGNKLTTDGLRFNLRTDLLDRIHQKIKRDEPILYRDLKLLHLVSAFDASAGKSLGLTFTQSLVLVKSMLLRSYVTSKVVPTGPEDTLEVLQGFVDKPDEIQGALQDLLSLTRANVVLQEQDIRQLANDYLKSTFKLLGDEEQFLRFVRDVFLHSLEHYLVTSAMVLLGVDDKDIQGHFKRGATEIFLYDNLPQGNGCSETLARLTKIPLAERTRVLRQAVEKDLPVTLPAQDFYSILEEFLLGCKANRADWTYLKLVRDARVSKLIPMCSTDDVVRQNLLQKLKEQSLDDFSISHLDSLLRYQSHYLVLEKMNEEELFFFKLVPEALLTKLSKNQKEAISPDIPSDNLDRNVLTKIQDALEMCIDGCPVCLYTSSCDMSAFNMKYFLSRRLLEIAYTLIKDDMIVTVGTETKERLLENALGALREKRVVYARSSYSDLKDLFDMAYQLLGQPLVEGRVYLKSLSFESSEQFVLKMEVG